MINMKKWMAKTSSFISQIKTYLALPAIATRTTTKSVAFTAGNSAVNGEFDLSNIIPSGYTLLASWVILTGAHDVYCYASATQANQNKMTFQLKRIGDTTTAKTVNPYVIILCVKNVLSMGGA